MYRISELIIRLESAKVMYGGIDVQSFCAAEWLMTINSVGDIAVVLLDGNTVFAICSDDLIPLRECEVTVEDELKV